MITILGILFTLIFAYSVVFPIVLTIIWCSRLEYVPEDNRKRAKIKIFLLVVTVSLVCNCLCYATSLFSASVLVFAVKAAEVLIIVLLSIYMLISWFIPQQVFVILGGKSVLNKSERRNTFLFSLFVLIVTVVVFQKLNNPIAVKMFEDFKHWL